MNFPYEVFVGLRYLRAKRRNRTISFNTLISIIGVTIGVAALIATLGIMTGFKEDLQSKILGTNSHIIITTRTGETIKDYAALTDKVAAVPEVIAATPFIFKQVLLTSRAARTASCCAVSMCGANRRSRRSRRTSAPASWRTWRRTSRPRPHRGSPASSSARSCRCGWAPSWAIG